jgi:hypothetical protein
VALDVAVGRSQAEGAVAVRRNPVDHWYSFLPDNLDPLAGELEGVAGVAYGTVAFEPRALPVRRDVVGFDQHPALDRDLADAAFLVVRMHRGSTGLGAADHGFLDAIPNEERPVGLVVDPVAVRGVDRTHREVHVGSRGT